MSKLKSVTSTFLSLVLSVPVYSFAQAAQSQVKRPPQFVMFAFDGSYTLDVWQRSRDFSLNERKDGVDARFTFFINPVYLLTRATSKYYSAPGGKHGSAIGWGDSVADVSSRVDQLNAAFAEGHEIGSHTIGHWDGSAWSEKDWDSEFSQFDYILQNLFSINDIRTTEKGHKDLLFKKEDIVGFRAPQLGVSSGLWPTLAKYGFKYDTSKTSKENYWPQKQEEGLWNFPLGRIQEPDGARTWLSMDYNFCVRDSARILSEDKKAMSRTAIDEKSGKTLKNNDKLCLRVITPEQKQAVKDNMMKLYRSYFEKNYYGNRAPVHIGHHFSPWMSGAYLEVFYEFANEVCGKPEVRCGVYKDLLKFMNSQNTQQVQAYQAGQFSKLPRPKGLLPAKHWDLSLNAEVDRQGQNVLVSLTGQDAGRRGLVLKVSNLGKTLDQNGVSLSDLRKTGQKGQDLVVRFAAYDRRGQEVATASYNLKAMGTEQEHFDAENIEEKWLAGHLSGAHSEEGREQTLDFTKGN